MVTIKLCLFFPGMSGGGGFGGMDSMGSMGGFGGRDLASVGRMGGECLYSGHFKAVMELPLKVILLCCVQTCFDPEWEGWIETLAMVTCQ